MSIHRSAVASACLALVSLGMATDLAGQGRPPSQVVIGVRFVEVSRGFSDDLGTRVGIGAEINKWLSGPDRNVRLVATGGKTFTEFDDQNVLNFNLGLQVDLLGSSLRPAAVPDVVLLPRIGPYGTIELEIQTVSFSNPVVDLDRRTETGMVLGGGARILLGGLRRARDGAENARIPVLGDIAVVGRLFGDYKRAQARVGLVILLKPTILASSAE